MRTAPPRLMRRHGRPYAENACLVRGGCDDSALAKTPYNDGLSTQRWLVALFDGCEEGIKIKMEHRGLASHASHCPAGSPAERAMCTERAEALVCSARSS